VMLVRHTAVINIALPSAKWVLHFFSISGC
jgi:hypothetical protein